MLMEMSPEFAIIKMQGQFLVYQQKELSEKSLCSPSEECVALWLQVRVPNKVMGHQGKLAMDFSSDWLVMVCAC